MSCEKRRESRITPGPSVLKSQLMEEKLEKMTEKDKNFEGMISHKPRRLRISRRILLTILNAIKRGPMKIMMINKLYDTIGQAML